MSHTHCFVSTQQTHPLSRIEPVHDESRLHQRPILAAGAIARGCHGRVPLPFRRPAAGHCNADYNNYDKVRPLRAAARGIPERGGAGQGTGVEKRAVHERR